MQKPEQKTQNRVPVIDADRKPLAPCTPRRARILVKQGKAQGRHRNGIYHLVLNRTVPSQLIQTASIMVNPGSTTTGIAVIQDRNDQSRTVLLGIELHHRGKTIKSNMTKRAQHRQTRRGRLRHRKPRFNNRRRKPGWLPPSLLSRLLNTLTWIDRISSLVAIKDIHVETQQFDAQRTGQPGYPWQGIPAGGPLPDHPQGLRHTPGRPPVHLLQPETRPLHPGPRGPPERQRPHHSRKRRGPPANGATKPRATALWRNTSAADPRSWHGCRHTSKDQWPPPPT